MQFRAGLKLIQQAYEDKFQALVEEVNTWKWISEEQSAQMTAMATELARVEEKHAALQKEAIVSMVDQHSGVSLTQLELSILETIEADTENADAGYDAIADADTSSFMLDNDTDTSVVPSSRQARYAREEVHSRDQKPSNGSSINLTSLKNGSSSDLTSFKNGSSLNLTSFKNSSSSNLTSFKRPPNSAVSRPRASTEASAKKSRTLYSSSRTENQSGRSPSKYSSGSTTRSGSAVLSDSSATGLKKMTKLDSVESLRSKRNTISSSPRSIYPNTTLTASDTAKRHSSVSPLSSRARAIVASSSTTSRGVAGSASFSTNSTPSTSPRQASIGATATSIAGSMASRTARQQQQQQKDYSLKVRNSMTQPANRSGTSPLTSIPQGNRKQTLADTSAVMPSKSSALNVSQITKRPQRSGSDTLPASGLSPAALKLLRQQEEQQQLEEENEYAQKSAAGHSHHGSHQHTDDEDYRRSVVLGHRHEQAYAHSTVNEGSRSVLQRNNSEAGYTSTPHNIRASGYESSARNQREESQYRQIASYGDKADKHAEGTANKNRVEKSGGSGSGGVDASAFTMLYKEIRDSMDASSFGMFARVVAAFNEGEKTTEETLGEVGKIVKDRTLNQRFRDLIHQAIAEKENQIENEGGNMTMEGDLTFDVDHSLLEDNDHNGNGGGVDDDIDDNNQADVGQTHEVGFSAKEENESFMREVVEADESMLEDQPVELDANLDQNPWEEMEHLHLQDEDVLEAKRDLKAMDEEEEGLESDGGVGKSGQIHARKLSM
ncbi:hypothetical protein BGZ54_009220 [Gamsiella multidivaricata]|nr:hypothetical protein BGZ54_009220 [Gamsiella multidivaricata]